MPRRPVRTSIVPSPRGPSVKIEQLLDSAGASKKTADFQKNQLIFCEGDAADTVLYLRKGLVRLSVTSRKGKEAIVEMLHPGDFFGTWCLAEHPFRMATATAMEPTTVRMISTNEMHRVLNNKDGLSGSFILNPSGKKYSNRPRLGQCTPEFDRKEAGPEASTARPVRETEQDRHNAARRRHPTDARRDDRNHAYAGEFLHEPIQAVRSHRIRRRTQDSPFPLAVCARRLTTRLLVVFLADRLNLLSEYWGPCIARQPGLVRRACRRVNDGSSCKEVSQRNGAGDFFLKGRLQK